MAEKSNASEFQAVWMAFTDSARPLFKPASDDRTLDQFLPFRDKVYTIVQGAGFVAGLDSALSFQATPAQLAKQRLDSSFGNTLREAYLEELRACTRAAEVLGSTESALATGEDARKKSKAQLSKVSTVLGSLKDVLGESPYLKTGVGLFKELVDFFR